MPVSEAMRRVEREIDEHLEQLPLWRCARDGVLKAALDYYRGVYEVILIESSSALANQNQEAFYILAQQLQRFQAGFFQVLKWALTLCPEQSKETFSHEMIHEVQELGSKYETLVDALRLAKHDFFEIVVDEKAQRVTVYEGGDVTGADWGLVEQQRHTNLFHSHVPLTDDADQLTTAWTAGAYRRTVAWLGNLTSDAQTDPVIFSLPSGVLVPLPHRPVIVGVPEPQDLQLRAVLDDLTLNAAKLTGSQLGRHVSWLDTPLVAVGAERLGPSDLLLALAIIGRDDHMLRLAAAVDVAQYVKVSGLREGRMIERCREVLEGEGWMVHPGYLLRDPPREIDVYAIRDGLHLVLELKSTLRPEAPWEVYKRNDDILAGIAQAQVARDRIGSGATGAVITDGYRGDYSTWHLATERQIPIGTLEDIPDIARNPHQMLELLQTRVGFDAAPPEGAPFERSCDLMGWTIRIVDSPVPSG